MYRPAHLEEGRTPTVFPKPIRVRIRLFLQHCWQGTPNGWHWLHELLKYDLGELHLGSGYYPEDKVEDFMLNCSERNFLRLLTLIPLAEIKTYEELCGKSSSSPFAVRSYGSLDQHIETLARGLNTILEESGNPARFNNDGVLVEDTWAEFSASNMAQLSSKEQLYEDVESFLRADETIALLMIDLDEFKKVNDENDHSVGDECLDKYVEIIQGCISKKGKLYRYGGDELVVVLRNFLQREAEPVAERIRRSIETSPELGRFEVTASVGVACTTNPSSTTAKNLVRAADKAMYASKSAGKNRVTLTVE